MYKGINYGLLMRYKKKLNSELQDLLWNKYDMEYICEHLQDIICEMEILESENMKNE